jgi:hypothetical protein
VVESAYNHDLDTVGFVPRVGRYVVTTRPWQTHVGILGGEFEA